jgi:hypothetical protein
VPNDMESLSPLGISPMFYNTLTPPTKVGVLLHNIKCPLSCILSLPLIFHSLIFFIYVTKPIRWQDV